MTRPYVIAVIALLAIGLPAHAAVDGLDHAIHLLSYFIMGVYWARDWYGIDT